MKLSLLTTHRVHSLWLCVALGAAACSDDGGGGAGSGSTAWGGDDESAAGTAGNADDGTAAADGTGSGDDGGGTDGDTDGDGSSDGGDGPTDWDAAFDHVFPQDHVVEINILPPPGVWTAMLAELDTTGERTYAESAMEFDDETIDSMGFRPKGWSSIDFGSGPGGVPNNGNSQPGGKFPVKVDFDRFDDTRFHDVNKINFGNNWADLSYMRERLANRLYAAMGVPAPRTAYARVSIDGNNNGLYTAVQQIDKTFLEEHFGDGNGNGNLYKAVITDTDMGALTWRGSTQADYVSTTTCPSADICGLVLKTNEDDPAKNDYADIIGFLDVLNNTATPQFEAAIEDVFDVDSFLRLAAVSVVTSSFDGYLGMGHNYYLYNRPDTGKFMMIPWDQNESYAGHPCAPDATEFDIYSPVCDQRGHDFALAYRIFAVPSFQAQYVAYIQELLDTVFTEEQHIEWITEFDNLIHRHIASDPNYIQSVDIYERSLGYDVPSGPNLGGHGGVEYNLMDFVVRRRAFVLSQL